MCLASCVCVQRAMAFMGVRCRICNKTLATQAYMYVYLGLYIYAWIARVLLQVLQRTPMRAVSLCTTQVHPAAAKVSSCMPLACSWLSTSKMPEYMCDHCCGLAGRPADGHDPWPCSLHVLSVGYQGTKHNHRNVLHATDSAQPVASCNQL